jgi:predicted RNA-binding protein with EMAP domain
MMDPIGRAFASLDADFTGTLEPAEIVEHPELAGTYASLAELLDAVAGSRAFAECFARHWLAFFLEQPLEEVDRVLIGELADEVAAGASLGDVIEQSIVSLAARSEGLVPWCEGT